jgi:hypothetical protein
MAFSGRAMEVAFSLPLIVVLKDYVVDVCSVQRETPLRKSTSRTDLNIAWLV